MKSALMISLKMLTSYFLDKDPPSSKLHSCCVKLQCSESLPLFSIDAVTFSAAIVYSWLSLQWRQQLWDKLWRGIIIVLSTVRVCLIFDFFFKVKRIDFLVHCLRKHTKHFAVRAISFHDGSIGQGGTESSSASCGFTSSGTDVIHCTKNSEEAEAATSNGHGARCRWYGGQCLVTTMLQLKLTIRLFCWRFSCFLYRKWKFCCKLYKFIYFL